MRDGSPRNWLLYRQQRRQSIHCMWFIRKEVCIADVIDNIFGNYLTAFRSDNRGHLHSLWLFYFCCYNKIPLAIRLFSKSWSQHFCKWTGARFTRFSFFHRTKMISMAHLFYFDLGWKTDEPIIHKQSCVDFSSCVNYMSNLKYFYGTVFEISWSQEIALWLPNRYSHDNKFLFCVMILTFE